MSAMPGCTVSREARGNTAWYSLTGRFEGACAWELSSLLGRELLPEIVLDFSRTTDFVDYSIAVVATALQDLEDKSVRLRGLRQHQLRMFKYFGVDPADLLRQGQLRVQVQVPEPRGLPAAPVARAREVG
jgi:hypothetical protein